MFKIEYFKSDCRNASTEAELVQQINSCARQYGYEVRDMDANLTDWFPTGYKTEEIGSFMVELENGNVMMTEDAVIPEREEKEIKFYANYADPGSIDYVYTFQII